VRVNGDAKQPRNVSGSWKFQLLDRKNRYKRKQHSRHMCLYNPSKTGIACIKSNTLATLALSTFGTGNRTKKEYEQTNMNRLNVETTSKRKQNEWEDDRRESRDNEFTSGGVVGRLFIYARTDGSRDRLYQTQTNKNN
jgi:hypothetical protein